MSKLLAIQEKSDIPEDFRDTPIADLLLYHNLKQSPKTYDKAQLIIGMCMDHRTRLNHPVRFAFKIRTGGAKLQFNDFHISYAIAIGGIGHVAVVGHTQCGMSNLNARKEQFIKGLVEHGGWDPKAAEAHFSRDSPNFEIGEEIDFVLKETERLTKKYPKVQVAPLLFKVEDCLLYWIENR